MKIKKILEGAIKILNKKKVYSAALDVEVILSYVLKKPKEFLYTHPDQKLTVSQEKKFWQLIWRRCRQEPVAYITGTKEFYGLNFFVNKNVLIPRPETELLIDEIINYSKLKIQNSKLHLADVGTGAGCLAITLSKQLPDVKIFATDISAAALKVARKNAKHHNVKIHWHRGDLLEPLKNCQLDIIAANLPYLNKKATNSEGLAFEPKLALDGGSDGMKFYKKLLWQIKKFHLEPRAIFCEIDPGQTNVFKKLVKRHLPTYAVEITKDLAGRERVVIIESGPLGKLGVCDGRPDVKSGSLARPACR